MERKEAHSAACHCHNIVVAHFTARTLLSVRKQLPESLVFSPLQSKGIKINTPAEVDISAVNPRIYRLECKHCGEVIYIVSTVHHMFVGVEPEMLQSDTVERFEVCQELAMPKLPAYFQSYFVMPEPCFSNSFLHSSMDYDDILDSDEDIMFSGAEANYLVGSFVDKSPLDYAWEAIV